MKPATMRRKAGQTILIAGALMSLAATLLLTPLASDYAPAVTLAKGLHGISLTICPLGLLITGQPENEEKS